MRSCVYSLITLTIQGDSLVQVISRCCTGPCDGDHFHLVVFLGSLVELMPLASWGNCKRSIHSEDERLVYCVYRSGSGDVDGSSRHWSGVYNVSTRPLVGWPSEFPTLNANSEFAVTALSECSSAQVILTWSLQYTALSKGWHRTRSLFWELDANSEFALHCLIGGLHCQGHTNLEFAVHCLIQGLTQDSWGAKAHSGGWFYLSIPPHQEFVVPEEGVV